jgi:hypothetical protein
MLFIDILAVRAEHAGACLRQACRQVKNFLHNSVDSSRNMLILWNFKEGSDIHLVAKD